METLDAPSSLPRRFGRYVLFDQIGEGGMARIFLGREKTELGGERLVVVKHILPVYASSSEFSKLLSDEAKLAARLTHGNVVQVYDLGREDGTLYIAMEYVEGFDLGELLKNCSRHKVPLPIEFSLLAVTETLKGLDYAHRKKDEDGRSLGIVHRDVSPSNVLVGFDGQIKVCDFGIARAMGPSTELPPEAIQGKAGYMSPEAARGDLLDARSDVFAVGVILWELIAGRRLYKGAEPGERPSLETARLAEIPALPARGYALETELHAVVAKALAKEQDDRYSSAKDMLRDLEAYIAGAALMASPLRFGEWLTENFGSEILERRRARERASRAVELEPAPPPPPPPAEEEKPPAASSLRLDAAPMSMEPMAHTVRSQEPDAGGAEKSSRMLIWIVMAMCAFVILAAMLLR
jgi:serine/threonine-protein kinase